MALSDNQIAQQALDVLRNRSQAGVSPRRLPSSEVEQLLGAAELLAKGRDLGISDDETLLRFTRELAAVRDRKDPRAADSRVQAALADLKAGGQAMDESDMKSAANIAKDEAEIGGYGSQEQSELGEGDSDAKYNKRTIQLEKNRRALRKLEKKAAGKKLNNWELKKVEQLRGYIEKTVEGQKTFDFGATPRDRVTIVDPERGVIQVAAGEPDMGVYRGNDKEESLRQRQLRNIELAEGRGARAAEERAFRMQQTDEEMQYAAEKEARRSLQDVGTLKRGIGPAQAVQVPLQMPAGKDGSVTHKTVIVPPLVDGVAQRGAEPGVGVEMRELTQQTPAPVMDTPYGPRAVGAEQAQMPGSIRHSVPVGVSKAESAVINRHAFNENDVDDVKAAILGQLRSRKDAGASMFAREAENRRVRQLEAEVMLLNNPTRGADVPNVINLGAVKNKSADMGVQIGNQRVNYPTAVRVEAADGSYEYVTPGNFPEPIGNTHQKSPIQVDDTHTALNAPTSNSQAEEWVNRNIYDNYGAQFFGDEGIVGQMNDKGSGGGIPQVAIGKELRGFEDLIAKELGERKGVRSVASLDRAVDAVLQQGKEKDYNFFRMEDGKKVINKANPGIEEVMWKLRMAPAEQQALANALFQVEGARRQNVDLEAKERYFAGGKYRDTSQGPYADMRVRGGVDNPARGGDNLDIAKDVQFANKAKAAVHSQLSENLGRLKKAEQDLRHADGQPASVTELAAHLGLTSDGIDRLRQGGTQISTDAAMPFVAKLQSDVDARKALRAEAQAAGSKYRDPRDDVQVFKGMHPIQVRIHQEGVQRKNAQSKGMKAKLGKMSSTERRDFKMEQKQEVRDMQEGNVLARLRAAGAEPMYGQYGNARVPQKNAVLRPGPRKPAPEAPKRRINESPTVTEAPQINLPEEYGRKDMGQQAQEVGNRIKDFATNPRYQKQRRIGYGVGGGLAALATILNLRDNEEEQY